MADTSLFSRLRRLFSSNVVVRNVGGKKLKVSDTSRTQSFSKTNLVDRYQKIFTGAGLSGYSDSLLTKSMRLNLFKDYESMDSDAIISSALDIYADESTMKSEYGEVLQINTDNNQIKEILHNLFYDIVNIEFNLWPWVRNMCKYGDFFLQLEIDEKYGVTNGTVSEDWIDEDLSKAELAPYYWPTDEEQNRLNIKAVFLGHFFEWDPLKTFKIAKQNGFTESDLPKTGYYKFADIDDSFLITVHHWMKWYKFGFTRLWDNLSIEIRNGRMKRNEAIQVIIDSVELNKVEIVDEDVIIDSSQMTSGILIEGIKDNQLKILDMKIINSIMVDQIKLIGYENRIIYDNNIKTESIGLDYNIECTTDSCFAENGKKLKVDYILLWNIDESGEKILIRLFKPKSSKDIIETYSISNPLVYITESGVYGLDLEIRKAIDYIFYQKLLYKNLSRSGKLHRWNKRFVKVGKYPFLLGISYLFIDKIFFDNPEQEQIIEPPGFPHNDS